MILTFIAGAFVGSAIAVITMCLLIAGNDWEDK